MDVWQCDTGPVQSAEAVNELRALMDGMSRDIVKIAMGQRSHKTQEEFSVTDAEQAVYAEKMTQFEVFQEAAIELQQDVL